MKKIIIIAGGISLEREISLLSSVNLDKWLKEIGYKTYVLDFKGDIIDLSEKITKFKPDVIYNTLHGTYGEDGRIQSVLDFFNIPYTGCDFISSCISMDKEISLNILNANSIPVSDYIAFSQNDDLQYYKAKINSLFLKGNGKTVVKPSNQGSSIGVSLCNNYKDVEIAINKIKNLSKDSKIIIESFIQGREVIVVVVCNGENYLSYVGEILIKENINSYEDKYTSNRAVIKKLELNKDTKKVLDKIKSIAVRSAKALRCNGLVRVDMRLEYKKSQYFPWVLEVNSTPGLTQTSSTPKILEILDVDIKKVLIKCIENPTFPIKKSIEI